MTVHKASFNFLFDVRGEVLFNPNTAISLSVPKGTIFLPSAGNQRDRVCVWYIPGRLTGFNLYRLWFLETGAKVSEVTPNELDFLGTVLLQEGEYVLHVFVERHPVE